MRMKRVLFGMAGVVVLLLLLAIPATADTCSCSDSLSISTEVTVPSSSVTPPEISGWQLYSGSNNSPGITISVTYGGAGAYTVTAEDTMAAAPFGGKRTFGPAGYLATYKLVTGGWEWCNNALDCTGEILQKSLHVAGSDPGYSFNVDLASTPTGPKNLYTGSGSTMVTGHFTQEVTKKDKPAKSLANPADGYRMIVTFTATAD